MTNEDLSIARELKRRLASCIDLVDLRVYGSRARASHEESSDMDVFVEVNEVTREIKDVIADTAWEVGLVHLMHISPLVFSREEIENSPLRSSPIVHNIMREGIRI